MKRNILTIATGKEVYINLALNLYLSFARWHTNSDVSFYLVTDREDLVPDKYKSKLNILSYPEGSIGKGFYPKISLDRFIPEGQTIFIDSDCLIFENIEWIFEQFKGRAVSVIGSYITEGEWFGNIKNICEKLGIDRLPKFNGGVYYLEKGDLVSRVYETAREIEKKYDEIGFVRFRGHPADELIMASAMALNEQHPIPDDSRIMSDLQACPGKYHINVISGDRYLNNPPAPHPLHQAWYPFKKVQPAIVHFLGYYTERYPYQRETFRLNKYLNKELNLITELKAKINIEYPARIKSALKNTLRPIYHSIFGFRKVKATERI